MNVIERSRMQYYMKAWIEPSYNIALLLTAICFSFTQAMDNYIPVLVLLSLGNVFAFLPIVLFWAIIVDTAPAHLGTYSGMMHFIAYIVKILAPTLTGYLVVSYGYSSMFIVAAILAAIAMGTMLIVKPGQQTES
ncbi:hypothetical protein ABE13_04985 [Bacillus wiedmannii]|nr:hypothetical protein [Bacillus wiedmannii]